MPRQEALLTVHFLWDGEPDRVVRHWHHAPGPGDEVRLDGRLGRAFNILWLDRDGPDDPDMIISLTEIRE
jgi:hypothetical protein